MDSSIKGHRCENFLTETSKKAFVKQSEYRNLPDLYNFSPSFFSYPFLPNTAVTLILSSLV